MSPLGRTVCVILVGAAFGVACGGTNIQTIPDQEVSLGESYRYQAVVSDGTPVTWIMTEGPDGMEINPISGQISWRVPDRPVEGPFPVVITALGEFQVLTERFDLRLESAPPRATRRNFDNTDGDWNDWLGIGVIGLVFFMLPSLVPK